MVLGRRTYIKSLNDEELVKVFQEKQWVDCIDEFYQRYSHLVFGVHLKYVKQREDAEDLTMELFEKLPELLLNHQIDYFKGWLFRVASNWALGILRKSKNNFQIPVEQQQLSEIEEEDWLEREKDLALLSMVINQLKDQQKRCITLFYLEQKSYDQITKITGCTFKEVKSHIQNGKRKLRILMEENQDYESK